MVFLPALGGAFDWSRVEAASIYTFLQLTGAVMAIPVGRLSDRRGPRWTFSAGFFLLGSGMLLASQASFLWQFVLCVGVLGGAGAVALGPIPIPALVSRWYEAGLTTSLCFAFAAAGIGILAFAPGTQVLIDTVGC